MYLSVIIPCFNETERIEKTLRSVDAYLRQQPFEYEIIVVNDGSTDDTVKHVFFLQSVVRNVRLIDHKENRGKGWAVHEGMLAAKGEVALFMDADNSTTIDQIEPMLEAMNDGFDVVIGSRRMPNSLIAVHQPLLRDLLGGIFRFLVRRALDLDLYDSQAGFKLFNRKARAEIFPRQTIFGWTFDADLLAIARARNLKIKEMPIVWRNDSQSRMNLGGMIHSLWEIGLIWKRRIAGDYQAGSDSKV